MTPHAYRFGPFTLDVTSYRVMRGDTSLPLPPKVIDLIHLFVQRPAALVTKDEILAALWPGIAVTDNAITQVVSELRQALGDHSSEPRFVQTVPRRGYRWISVVEVIDLAPVLSSAAQPAPAAVSRSTLRSVAVMDFVNVTGEADVAWLAAGIAETITNDLRAIRDLRLVDRALLNRAADSTSTEGAAAAGIDLLIVGSYQRSGERLRITARVVEPCTQAVLASAKADGSLAGVFALQDAIVTDLSAGLRLTLTPGAAARASARETSNLDAYRAATEGRLKLETLDPTDVASAMGDFERAVTLDPQYAIAHVGLAHAHFWRFQASRMRSRPDAEALAAAIAHASRAAKLDADLAEAHSALAFFLVSEGRTVEAVDAGRLAVSLEPANWRHHFRLAIAAWGDERLACFDQVIAQFPELGYAYFGIAMVHIARGNLVAAEETLRRGITRADRRSEHVNRFPGRGLHWLLGMTRLAAGDDETARAEFDRELATTGRGLLAEEFTMDAYVGHGFARLASGDATGAADMFRGALRRFPEHARSLIGLAAADRRCGLMTSADQAAAAAERAIAALSGPGGMLEAAMTRAIAQSLAGATTEAIATLTQILAFAPPGFAGWTMPVEPAFAPLRTHPAFQGVLAKLADRAR
jgi:DNA-binding winged helix-turn-helix (wHTH) protein/tetratricopeptide (TPR) repeat protein